MNHNLKFVGKPAFKSNRTYYTFLVCLWLCLIALLGALYCCYFCWDSPTYLEIFLWVLLGAVTMGGERVYFTSYEKYKSEFIDSQDETEVKGNPS